MLVGQFDLFHLLRSGCAVTKQSKSQRRREQHTQKPATRAHRVSISNERHGMVLHLDTSLAIPQFWPRHDRFDGAAASAPCSWKQQLDPRSSPILCKNKNRGRPPGGGESDRDQVPVSAHEVTASLLETPDFEHVLVNSAAVLKKYPGC